MKTNINAYVCKWIISFCWNINKFRLSISRNRNDTNTSELRPGDEISISASISCISESIEDGFISFCLNVDEKNYKLYFSFFALTWIVIGWSTNEMKFREILPEYSDGIIGPILQSSFSKQHIIESSFSRLINGEDRNLQLLSVEKIDLSKLG